MNTKILPGKLAVYYGLEVVGVWPVSSKRNALKDAVLGPFERTPENIRYCNTFAAATELLEVLMRTEATLEAAFHRVPGGDALGCRNDIGGALTAVRKALNKATGNN